MAPGTNDTAANGSRPDASGDASTAQQSPFRAPKIDLPKGGGAIRGIDEKFEAVPVTGTGSLAISLAITQPRRGFGPNLSLSYDLGTGNGPVGMGMNLSIPSITYKTSKGIPRYLDSDVFILSGSEDLMPKLIGDRAGEWIAEELERLGYRIRLYRPRIRRAVRAHRALDAHRGRRHALAHLVEGQRARRLR